MRTAVCIVAIVAYSAGLLVATHALQHRAGIEGQVTDFEYSTEDYTRTCGRWGAGVKPLVQPCEVGRVA
jgi:hypothetical protein